MDLFSLASSVWGMYGIIHCIPSGSVWGTAFLRCSKSSFFSRFCGPMPLETSKNLTQSTAKLKHHSVVSSNSTFESTWKCSSSELSEYISPYLWGPTSQLMRVYDHSYIHYIMTSGHSQVWRFIKCLTSFARGSQLSKPIHGVQHNWNSPDKSWRRCVHSDLNELKPRKGKRWNKDDTL